jgi:ParB-like chromosome segregation protein Spo0J
MKIELTQIRLDGNTQPRVSLNEEVVAEYTEGVMNGSVFPGVTVFHDGSAYWLADGFHRFFAHKRAGHKEIEANVRTGTLRDALLFSVGANDKHGLRRSNEDKRRAVLILLNDPEWSEWSDMEIARQAGVSNATVHRIKKSLQLEEKPERKFTKNGNEHSMNVKKLLAPQKKEEYHHDPLAEMATELEAVMEENKRLKEDIALENADLPEEEKLDIHEQLEHHRQKTKVLEMELTAVKRTRDSLQNENAELKKQVLYWKKRFQSVIPKDA